MNRAQIKAFYPLTLSVRRLFHKLADGATALHAGCDVTVGMRAVLESVIGGGPQTVPHMARVRPVTRQHIQALVNALLAGGYVEQIDNPHHKRSKLIAPTARGRQVFNDLRARETEAFRRLPLELSPRDLETAAKVLTTLIAAFESPQWHSIVGREPQEMEDV